MGIYDKEYPAGPGPRPVYPDPTGIYTPLGSNVRPMAQPRMDPMPPAEAAAVPRPAVATPWKLPTLNTSTSPGQADQDVASAQVANKAVPPALPKFYGADESFGPNDFRTRLAKTATPGEQIVKDYGMGGPMVVATADKNGRFNSFSQGPIGTGTVAPVSGIGADIANVQAQLKQWKGNNTLTGIIMSKGLRAQLTNLRAQQVQEGQLGVQQRQATTQEQIAYPQIAMATHEFGLATGGDKNLDALRTLAAARRGASDLTPVTTQFSAAAIPTTTINKMGGYQVGAIPGMAVSPIGAPQYAPQPVVDVSKIGHLKDYPEFQR